MNPTILTAQFFFYWTVFFGVFLMFSVVFGHGHDHVGHTVGHGGLGHHDLGHHTGASHTAHSEHNNVSNMRFVSLRTIMAFMSGFGVGGYFAAINNVPPLARLVCGCGSGLLLSMIVYSVLNWLYKSQSVPLSDDDYVGVEGYVQVTIGNHSAGKVYCTVRGSGVALLAQTADGSSLPLNTQIRIARMNGSIAIVEQLVAQPKPQLVR